MNISVDIVIPCYNSEKTLQQCINSIKSLKYPSDLINVIFVDNGSADATVNIIISNNYKYIVIDEHKVGLLRNSGAQCLVGDVIAFTDSDCILPEHWISDAIKKLDDSTVGAVGGGCIAPQDGTWMEKAWVALQSEPVISVDTLPASNFIIKRDVFNLLGGFDVNIVSGEDDKLSTLLREKGYQLLSIKSCYVIHLGWPQKYWQVIKREMWHGSNTLQVIKSKHDKVFVATNLYVLMIIGIPISALFDKSYISFNVSVLLIINFLSALKKASNNNQSIYIKQLFQLNILFFYYYIGRSIGLIKSYYSIFRHTDIKIINS